MVILQVDVFSIYKTGKQVDIQGIVNHQVKEIVIILPSYTNMHMKRQDSLSSRSNGSRILYVRYTKFVRSRTITTISNYVRPLSSISGLSDLHIWLVQMMIGKQSQFKSLRVTTINLDYSIDADDPTWYKFIHNSHP